MLPFFIITNLVVFYYYNMIILQNTSDSQTFNFIPRSYTDGLTYAIKIINETTNKNVYNSTATSFTSVDYYYQHSDTFTLVEDNFYTIEITQSDNVIFRDKIYCTNQTISSYSINNDQYTVNSETNEFIVL